MEVRIKWREREKEERGEREGVREREEKKRKMQHVHQILSSLIITGVWYTEYAYINYDRDITDPTACEARNNNNEDGYRRIWAKPTYYDDNYRCLILPGPPECVQAGWLVEG